MRKAIVAGVLSLGLSAFGCTSLPYMYKPGLTVESESYREAVKHEISEISEKNDESSLERVLRMSSVINCPVNFSVAGYGLIELETKDGKIIVSKWEAKNDTGEVMIYLNGLESHSGWFAETARQLAEKEVSVYALDSRGSGLNCRIRGNKTNWIDDIDLVVEKAREENKGKDINLASICFGAKLATAYAVKHPEKINSLIYYSPGFELKVAPDFFQAGEIFFAGLVGLNMHVNSPIKRDEMFTSNPKYLEFLAEDKLRTVSPNSRDYTGGFWLEVDCRQHMHELNIPTIVFLGGRDEIVDLNETYKFFRRMENVEFTIYPDAEHALFWEEEVDLLGDTLKFMREH